MVVVAIAVVVVAAAVVGGLVATGTLHLSSASSKSNGSGSPGGNSGAGESYSAAASAAASTVSSVSGGPWTLAGGTGVVIASPVTVTASELNATAAGGGCKPQLLAGASGITTIPATTSSASSGDSDAWVVWYVDASFEVLEVAVFGGVATPVLTLSVYGGCATSSTLSGIALPSDYTDSPSAAATAYKDGGSAWIGAWPNYDLTEILVPGTTITVDDKSTSLPASWEVTYTTCDLGAGTGATLGGQMRAEYAVSINASSGAFLRGYNSTAACPASETPAKGSPTVLLGVPAIPVGVDQNAILAARLA